MSKTFLSIKILPHRFYKQGLSLKKYSTSSFIYIYIKFFHMYFLTSTPKCIHVLVKRTLLQSELRTEISCIFIS